MVDVINPDWIDVPQHRPTFVKIKNSKIHGKGAFAHKNIKKGTFLGHYMGIIYPKYVTGDYVFHSHRETATQKEDRFDASMASNLFFCFESAKSPRQRIVRSRRATSNPRRC